MVEQVFRRELACLVLPLWFALLSATPASAQPFLGDANLDGRFGQADILLTVEAILETTTPPGNPDCSENGSVDVLDVVCIANKISSSLPQISGFSPLEGIPGTSVTVSGSYLTLPDGRPVQVLLARRGGGEIEAPLTGVSSSSLTFVIPPGATSGPVKVVAPERPPYSSAQTLVVRNRSNFQLIAAPSLATLIRGQDTALVFSLESADGFSQLATLQLPGLPSGVAATFFPPQIAPGQISVLTLSASQNAALGSFPLVAAATAEQGGIALQSMAPINLEVVPVTTSFRGRTVVADALQAPLAGITVKALGVDGSGNPTGCSAETVSDAAGNFVLSNLPANCTGGQLIRYDGATATSPPGVYAGVDLFYTLPAGQVTTSPVLVHLPRLNQAPTVWVQQNAPFDQDFTFDGLLDLSLTVYAGTVIHMADGSAPDPFPLVAVDVPVDRLPDQMPPSSSTIESFIVAFQPANATASQPIAVSFPNFLHVAPNTEMSLSTLDPTLGVMVLYGTGKVSADGRQIVPNLDPAHPGKRYGIVHFDWHGPVQPAPPRVDPAPPGSGPCPEGIKPIDPVSGVEILQEVDLVLASSRGEVAIRRTYRTLSAEVGPFGLGSGHNFSYRLDSNNPAGVAQINLVLPDGNRIPFVRGQDSLMRNATIPEFAGATLETPTGAQAILKKKDGSAMSFKPSTALLGSLLVSTRDRVGNQVQLVRDVNRPVRINEIVDPVGRRLRLTYDTTDRITSITDPIGREVSYTYNGQGALETFTDAANGITTYTYDGQNRLFKVTDPRGIVVAQNAYDANGRAIEQVQADGGVWHFAYTLANPLVPSSPVLVTRITNPRGFATTYRFNPQGFLLSVTDALGQTRVFEREEGTNRLLSLSGPANCEICGGSAAQGDLSYTYNSVGNLVELKDSLAHTTSFTYDPRFELVASVTDALGQITSVTYDDRGLLETSTDARGNTTTRTYDSLGQLTKIDDPLGFDVQFGYDGFGNVVAVRDAAGETSTWTYDAISRPIEHTDPRGNHSFFEYDALSRVRQITDAKGNAIAFEYDEVGNLLSVTDARGNTTSYSYDGLHRLLSRTDSRGTITTWQYDFNGNVISYVDRRGQTSEFEYDELDRLVLETYQDGSVSRRYDSRSRLLEVTDTLGGEYSFEYDELGRRAREVSPVGVVEYVRDALGRVETRQVVGYPPVDYTYDEVGQLLSASMPQLSTTFTFDERNLPIRQDRSNGVSSTYVYDPVGRVVSFIHAKGAQILDNQSYGYDANGNRSSYSSTTAQPLATPASVNSYDPDSNRLLLWGSKQFTYDAEGNRLSETDGAGTTTYEWDSRGRLTRIVRPAAVTAFKYDFAGNLITQADTGSGDPRVQTFVVDEIANVVAQTDRGLALAVLTGVAMDQHFGVLPSTGAAKLGLPDVLNSSVGVVDSAGVLVETYAYEPFGATSPTGDGEYPFQFTGRRPIGEDLYFYRARFYDAKVSRFLSEDRLDFAAGDLNLNRYARNSPTNFVDPTGNFVPLVLGIALAGYGAYQFYDAFDELLDRAKGFEDASRACADLAEGKGGCDQDDLLRKCLDRDNAALRTLASGLKLGRNTPGTSFAGPVPESLPGLIGDFVKSILDPSF